MIKPRAKFYPKHTHYRNFVNTPMEIKFDISSTNLMWFGLPEAIALLKITGVKSLSSAPTYVERTHSSAQNPVMITVSTLSCLSLSFSLVFYKRITIRLYYPQIMWLKFHAFMNLKL